MLEAGRYNSELARLLAAVAAAAGAYFFYGKRGAKNREKVSDWAHDLKDGALEGMAKLKALKPEIPNGHRKDVEAAGPRA